MRVFRKFGLSMRFRIVWTRGISPKASGRDFVSGVESWVCFLRFPFASKRRRLQDSCTSQRDSYRVIVNEYLLLGDVFPGLPQVWVVNAVPDRLAKEQRGPEASHQKLPAGTS